MRNSIYEIRKLRLDDMIRSDDFDAYIGDKLGNDLFINDPDRADRIYNAAEFGGDGSTHSEIIEDWRDFLHLQKLPAQVKARIEKEIDDCELWHEEHGSLYQQVG